MAYIRDFHYLSTLPNHLVPDCDGVMCAEFPSRELLLDKYYTAAKTTEAVRLAIKNS